jgi:hypothetical protein
VTIQQGGGETLSSGCSHQASARPNYVEQVPWCQQTGRTVGSKHIGERGCKYPRLPGQYAKEAVNGRRLGNAGLGKQEWTHMMADDCLDPLGFSILKQNLCSLVNDRRLICS